MFCFRNDLVKPLFSFNSLHLAQYIIRPQAVLDKNDYLITFIITITSSEQIYFLPSEPRQRRNSGAGRFDKRGIFYTAVVVDEYVLKSNKY